MTGSLSSYSSANTTQSSTDSGQRGDVRAFGPPDNMLVGTKKDHGLRRMPHCKGICSEYWELLEDRMRLVGHELPRKQVGEEGSVTEEAVVCRLMCLECRKETKEVPSDTTGHYVTTVRFRRLSIRTSSPIRGLLLAL